MARPTNADRGPVRQRLIAAREARGLDRAQAAAGAGISLRYLVMLEEGQYPLVSDPAYLSPFIRRYAAFLDLPPEPTVVAFLSETEVAERVAAASVTLPKVVPEEERERRGRPLLIAAMVVAVGGGAAAAFVDLPTARRWLGSLRPTVERFGGTVDRVAASVGRVAGGARATLAGWLGDEASPPPVDVASAGPAA
ncbi:MAG: helix-turn-helix domain-containing protein, partial [Candidatus Binatia bacterium]